MYWKSGSDLVRDFSHHNLYEICTCSEFLKSGTYLMIAHQAEVVQHPTQYLVDMSALGLWAMRDDERYQTSHPLLCGWALSMYVNERICTYMHATLS